MAEVARRVYADALFEAALEENALTEVKAELRELEGLLRQTPEFLTMLSSPALTPDEKRGILQRTLEGKISPYLYNFLRILSDKGRTPLFFEIAEEFYALCRRHDGILLVTASTAVPLSDSQKARLTEKLCALTGKKVELQCGVDPALLGGVVLRYEGSEMDGSVRQRLDTLRRRLTSTIA